LDQIISFSGQNVVDEDVRDVLGFIPSEILDRTLDALADRDCKALLENIGIVIDQGLNPQQYVREFIGRVRDLLVLKLGLEDKVLGSVEEKRNWAGRGAAFSEQDLIRFFDMLLRIENDLRWTSQARFHLEVGFVKLAKIGYVRDIEEVLREVKQGKAPGQPVSSSLPRPASPAAPRVQTIPPAAGREPEANHEEKSSPSSPETFAFSGTFNRQVEHKSATTSVYLQKAERIERKNDTVEIVMTAGTPLAMLQSKEHKSVLDAVASELVGKAVSVSLIMKDQQKDAASAESAKDEPLVKSFLEVFRGDLAQVKPAKGE
jgi:DNA polymerase III gamma/tau subunit